MKVGKYYRQSESSSWVSNQILTGNITLLSYYTTRPPPSNFVRWKRVLPSWKILDSLARVSTQQYVNCTWHFGSFPQIYLWITLWALSLKDLLPIFFHNTTQQASGITHKNQRPTNFIAYATTLIGTEVNMNENTRMERSKTRWLSSSMRTMAPTLKTWLHGKICVYGLISSLFLAPLNVVVK